MKITHLLRILFASILSLSIIACNDDDGKSGGSQNAPSSMAGATVSFNPTVEFTDGTNFVYTNNEAGSSFPMGTLNGTYTYTATGAKTATIVLTATDIGGAGVDVISVDLSNFVGTSASIATFDLTVDGDVYSAKVTSGTLVPVANSSGSGGNGTAVRPATVNPAFVGTHTLTFFGAYGDPVPASSPHQVGDVIAFEITADGKLIFEGRTLTEPFFLGANEYEIIWYDGTYGYAASGDQSLNEINFGEGYDYYVPGGAANAFTFIGQFNDK